MATFLHSIEWHLGGYLAPVLIGAAIAAGFYVLIMAGIRQVTRWVKRSGGAR